MSSDALTPTLPTLPTLSIDRAQAVVGAGRDGRPEDEMTRALMRGFIVALMTEGRRFATTPAGRRWREVLAEASLVREGRMLWGRAGLDLFVRGADLGPGSPRAMAEEILALLDVHQEGVALVVEVLEEGAGAHA